MWVFVRLLKPFYVVVSNVFYAFLSHVRLVWKVRIFGRVFWTEKWVIRLASNLKQGIFILLGLDIREGCLHQQTQRIKQRSMCRDNFLQKKVSLHFF